MSELGRTFALASAFKEGDLSIGGTTDDDVRQEARAELAATTLGAIARHAFVDDGVTEAIAHSVDRARAAEIASHTVADVRAILLSDAAPDWVARHAPSLRSEVTAAVAKISSDAELSAISRRLFHALPASGPGIAIGSAAHFGSRIQPNSPGDDEEEILFSILEGLAHGCGDVILGLNPASDDLETIVRLENLLMSVVERLELPTRTCVLSDIVKQASARSRTRVDVGFQSLAGTSRSLGGMVGLDVDGIADLAAGFDGLYFETGQGSEVTNGAAEGVDMTTLEARTYGAARAIRRRCGGKWTIVNDVAGFIGPEVFRTGEQLRRACLEDVVMAKLHGLTMGLDVCSTFHMGIAPAELQALTADITERAAPAYLMAVAGNADPMLGYLTTSFREHLRLRRLTGRRMTTAMERRLQALGAGDGAADATAALYARYRKAGGDARGEEALRAEGARRIAALAERGFDLGFGPGTAEADPPEIRRRIEAIHANARHALYAEIDATVLRDAAPRALRVRTLAASRDDFLAHPPSGERIRDADVARIVALHPAQRPRLQIIVSDGLNADAVNENLRSLLPPLRARLGEAASAEIVVTNGRVRAGYHVGEVLDVDAVLHFIGERPGTGWNTLSAYLTWGRDADGRSRWSGGLDHSATTAICGIHPRGNPPEEAIDEIARAVARMFERRASGVALQ